MITHIKRLTHFRIGPDEVPGRHGDSGKGIGDYTSQARALFGKARVADLPGFCDWPDGFRLFHFDVDHDYFREGFRTGTGEDVAIAGDSSGYVGNDEGLEEWGDHESEEDALFNLPDRVPDESSEEGRSCPLWELGHYKISARNGQSYGDMGFKLVGIYSSVARTRAAIMRLRDKPGFRDWPEGWRIDGVALDQDHWLEGFATVDHDEAVWIRPS